MAAAASNQTKWNTTNITREKPSRCSHHNYRTKSDVSRSPQATNSSLQLNGSRGASNETLNASDKKHQSAVVDINDDGNSSIASVGRGGGGNGNGGSGNNNGSPVKGDRPGEEKSALSPSNAKQRMSNLCGRLARNACNKKQLQRKLPITEWLPKYNGNFALSDLIAGITVGLTVIPQGIAYAIVAELPPQYGLYSAFMGCFVYMFFGTSKDVTVGPTAIMALMTAQYASRGPLFVVLLTFLSGLVIMALGILRLGMVIDFISVPVIAGFTSAAAITIASSQVKSIFGLEIVHHLDLHIEGILKTWIEIVDNFDSIRVADTLLGLGCVVILLLMRAMKNVTWFDVPDEEEGTEPTTCQSLCARLPSKVRFGLSKLIWILSTARNAVVVVTCALVAYGTDPVLPEDPHSRNTTFLLTGNIQSGLPPFAIPPFSATDDKGNYISFSEMVGDLGEALIIIPLIAILENIAIAKAFAGGKQLDASQEMVALGLCNVFGSFVSSMPITGSFSRTAVNCSSGVKTQFGGLYTGALVLLALGLLMPFCAYIPKASLAAVIITAVIFSVEYEVVRPMWRSKRVDLIPAFATFFCCLFWALEYGILVGVVVQIIFILYNSARPSVRVEIQQLSSCGKTYLWTSPDRALYFPSINYIRNVINKAASAGEGAGLAVVVDCSHISSTDFTAAKGFKAMISDFQSRGQPLIFHNAQTSVMDTFTGAIGTNIVVTHSIQELHVCLHALMCTDPETGVVMCTSVTNSRRHSDSLMEEEDFSERVVVANQSQALVANDDDDNDDDDDKNAAATAAESKQNRSDHQ